MESGSGFGDPRVAAEGAAALQAGFDFVEFFFGEGLIDVLRPVAGDVQGPGGKQIVYFAVVIEAGVEAAVGPELGAASEVGGEGIALDVAAESQEVLVALDGE